MSNALSTVETPDLHFLSHPTAVQDSQKILGVKFIHIALWLATVFTLSLIIVIVWRPFSSNAMLHNTVTLILLAVNCLTLVSTGFVVNTVRDWCLLAVHVVITGFLLRSVPVLLLHYPSVNDAYFYYITLLNITEGHSLAPVFNDWYGGTWRQVKWPIFQLLTAQFGSWSNISSIELWKFTSPAIGSLSFVAIGLVAQSVFQNWRLAALAGLLGSFSDLILFYQSQYHPQGAAVIFCLFLLYMIFTSQTHAKLGLNLLVLLVGTTFIFSHHASSLIIPLLLTPTLLVPDLVKLARACANYSPFNKNRITRLGCSISKNAEELVRYRSTLLFLIVMGLFVHIYLSNDIISLATRRVDDATKTLSWNVATQSIPWWVNTLRRSKYILLSLSSLGLVFALLQPSTRTVFLGVLTALLACMALISPFLMTSITLRFFAFWYPLSAIFASLAIVTFVRRTEIFRPWFRVSISITTISIYIFMSILNAQVPAYFLDGTPRSSDIPYGNARPRLDRLALAGSWIRDNTPMDSKYATDMATNPATILFGQRRNSQMIYNESNAEHYCKADYFIIDYLLDDGYNFKPRVMINYFDYPRIYDNGSVAIFQHLSAIPCRK